jgi:hypothetical protein
MRAINVIVIVLAAAFLAAGCTSVYYVEPDTPPPSGSQRYPGGSTYTGPPKVGIGKPDYMHYIYDFDVYYIPSIKYEIFYTNGLWYFRYNSAWYWGNNHNGPWTIVSARRLPRGLAKLPDRYRSSRYKMRRVPYGYWKKEPPGQAKKRYKKPPVLGIARPGLVIYLPSFGIYYIPDSRFEVFFIAGNWYRFYENRWYASTIYKGPWDSVSDRDLPRELKKLPRNYRDRKHRAEKVPYGHWNRRVPDRIGKKYDDDRHDNRRRDRDDDDRDDRRRDWDDDDDRGDRRRDWDDDDDRDDRRRDWDDDDDRDDRRSGKDKNKDKDRDWQRDKRMKDTTSPPPPVQKDRDRRDRQPPPGLSSYSYSRPKLMYHIPSMGVYYVPKVKEDIFYYERQWYTRVGDSWYSGTGYNGPWQGLSYRQVPGALKNVPVDYRARKDQLDTKIVPYEHWRR